MATSSLLHVLLWVGAAPASLGPALRFEAGAPTLVRAQEDYKHGLLYFPATLQAFPPSGQLLLSETTLGDEPQGFGWAGRNFASARNGTAPWVELTPSFPNVNHSALRPGQWMVRPCVLLPGSLTDWVCMNYVLRRAPSMSNTSGELVGTVFQASESGVKITGGRSIKVDFGTSGRAPKLQTGGSSFRMSTGGNILAAQGGGYLMALFGNTCPVGHDGCFVNATTDYSDYQLWTFFSPDALSWVPRGFICESCPSCGSLVPSRGCNRVVPRFRRLVGLSACTPAVGVG